VAVKTGKRTDLLHVDLNSCRGKSAALPFSFATPVTG